MLEELKELVYQENIRLYNSGLVKLTWGNVSAIDRKLNLIVIKPSGVSYMDMKIEDMVVVDMNGNVVEGLLKPSSDTLTHLEIYKNFKDVVSVCHTHSTFAVAYSQARKEIIPYGTTHADSFYGNVPITRELTKEEIFNDYELNTGKVIIERFNNLNPLEVPAVLVSSHGPFTWGNKINSAVDNAIILEETAKMAYLTETLNKEIKAVNQDLLDKHYKRKHGKDAYYGQGKK